MLTVTQKGNKQQTWSCVLQCEVLIRKLLSIDTLATSPIAPCKVASLTHEVRDDTVKG